MRPILSAYEQVADQLRELIARGELQPGERLPAELELGRRFGVSRATVREALKMLAAQDLVRSAKGRTGGTFVTLPSVDYIAEFMRSSVALLTEAESVTLDELLQARELIEVPAARLAAENCSPAILEQLSATVPEGALRLPVDQQFVLNSEFHALVIEACGNVLLRIATRPVFSVLQTHLRRSALRASFHRAVHAQHRELNALIAAADADAAAEAMKAHLDFLRPSYERAWREASRTRSRGGGA